MKIKERKSFIIALMIIFSLCLLTSCKSGTNNDDKDNAEKTKNSHYPVTITTYDNDKKPVKMVFKKAPKKVIAVYQNSIETMLALGLEDHIVAASGLDFNVKDEYKEAFKKINYLTEFKPNKETVMSYSPDMILSWHSIFSDKNLGSMKDWQSKGINCYSSLNSGGTDSRTLKNEYTDILNLGKIFNVEKKAEKIVNEMKNKVSEALEFSKKNKKTKDPKVLIIENHDGKITNYGGDSLGGDMVKALGGKLVREKAPSLSKEDLIAANPDVIFVVYMDRDNKNIGEQVKKEVLDDKAYSTVNAIKNKRVFPIQLAEMYCSGIRTLDGIKTFAEGMYPGLKFDDNK